MRVTPSGGDSMCATRSDSGVADPDAEPGIEACSPSAKLVYTVLEHEGAMTQEEIARESRLCSRTVRYAVGILEDHGLVRSRASLEDARQSIYRIDG